MPTALYQEPGQRGFDEQNLEVIEVRLLELKQLFNSFDPSPFRERDLNSDAADFIVGWARETPRDKRFALRVHLEQLIGPEAPEVLGIAVREYFKSRAAGCRLQLRQLFRVGRISLIIGVLFLGGCLILSDLTEEMFRGWRFARLVQESLVIGGWVAMWRPLEIFLYEWWPIRSEARLNERLSIMPVEIISHSPRRT